MVRCAAVAVTPTDSAILEADPTRMDMLAQKIVGMADAMKALAATAAPDDRTRSPSSPRSPSSASRSSRRRAAVAKRAPPAPHTPSDPARRSTPTPR